MQNQLVLFQMINATKMIINYESANENVRITQIIVRKRLKPVRHVRNAGLQIDF